MSHEILIKRKDNGLQSMLYIVAPIKLLIICQKTTDLQCKNRYWTKLKLTYTGTHTNTSMRLHSRRTSHSLRLWLRVLSAHSTTKPAICGCSRCLSLSLFVSLSVSKIGNGAGAVNKRGSLALFSSFGGGLSLWTGNSGPLNRAEQQTRQNKTKQNSRKSIKHKQSAGVRKQQ